MQTQTSSDSFFKEKNQWYQVDGWRLPLAVSYKPKIIHME